MTPAELVEALAVQITVDGREGPSYLQQLRGARGSSLGRGSGGSAGASERSTLNLAAHMLWEDLTGQIATQFTGASTFKPSTVPELNLLAWWAAFTAAQARDETTPLQLEVAGDRLQGWANRIVTLLDPPLLRPLRRTSCPECGFDRVRTGEGVLAAVVDALVLVGGDEISVSCLSCGAQWTGLVDVVAMARAAGVVLDADAIRESRAPVEDTWVEDEHREELFDPTNPEHAVLVDGTSGDSQ